MKKAIKKTVKVKKPKYTIDMTNAVNIKVIEQVETFVENMTGTAGEVCYLQIC